MFYQNQLRTSLLTVVSLFMVFLMRPTLTHASWYLSVGDRDRQHGRYTQVVVGPDRYYYDQGVFYTGTTGHYVAVEAPVGAVVYSVPTGYERVAIDGNDYYRYRDVYYRHGPRGYEVARVEKSHGQGRDNSQGHNDNHRHD